MIKKFDHDKKAPTPDVPLIKSDFYNPFGFQGMWRDEHTGLYHTHYRILNPNHARWLTPDPAGYVDGQNLYRFYGGPNSVDPLGDERVNHKGVKDDNGKYYRVEKGDNLWRIAKKLTGKGSNFPNIGYDIKTEDFIKTGQIINIAGLFHKKFKFKPLKNADSQAFIWDQNADMMKLAESSYNTTGAPAGFRRIGLFELKKMGIKPESLYQNVIGLGGFYSVLYTDDNGTYFYVLRGTDDLKDMIPNIKQGLGLYAKAYTQAIRTGDKINEVVSNLGAKLHVVGHSLGGGLGSAIALNSNVTATTINAAGLHKKTVGNRKNQYNLINSFYLEGEILTYLQEQSVVFKRAMPDAVGNRILISPPYLPELSGSWPSRMINMPTYDYWRGIMHTTGAIKQTLDYRK